VARALAVKAKAQTPALHVFLLSGVKQRAQFKSRHDNAVKLQQRKLWNQQQQQLNWKRPEQLEQAGATLQTTLCGDATARETQQDQCLHDLFEACHKGARVILECFLV
jgi:hypothetical protein